MPISNVALTNTFDEWRVTTNQLVVVTNDLLGDGLTTYRSVTANVITANTLFLNTFDVISVLSSTFDRANAANLVANVAFDTANAAFLKANVATLIANVAFDRANDAVLKTGDTMTGTLVVPTINVSQNFRVTGGTIDTTSANVLSQTLTDGATISWNAQNGQIATVTLGGNRVLANINNPRIGTYILHVIQDGVGGRNLTFEQGYRFTGNIAPPLTQTANARDVFTFVSDGFRMYGSFIPDIG